MQNPMLLWYLLITKDFQGWLSTASMDLLLNYTTVSPCVTHASLLQYIISTYISLLATQRYQRCQALSGKAGEGNLEAN